MTAPQDTDIMLDDGHDKARPPAPFAPAAPIDVTQPSGPVQVITPGQIGTVIFWLTAGAFVILGLWALLVISDCPKDSISQYSLNVANLVIGGFLSTVSYYFGRQHGGGGDDDAGRA